MKKRAQFYFLFFVLAICTSCKKDNKLDITTEYLASLDFKFEAKYNPSITEDVVCEFREDEIHALIPILDVDKSRLVLSFNDKVTLEVNEKRQVSGSTTNDFSNPLSYRIKFSNGESRNYIVKVKEFTGLPILKITTVDNAPVVSKSTYLNGQLHVNTNYGYEQDLLNLPMEIRGRGNSTWGMPKKPYRIRLNKKARVLGLSEARNWVLLANYSDKTLIRTGLAFDFGRAIGADFVPEYRHVEVVLNNNYIGTYTLTEQVEVYADRVDIHELKPVDVGVESITGGYLLELDQRRDEDYIVETSIKKLPFAIKSPSNITHEQLRYIEKYLQDTENAIFADNFADPINGYAKYINVDSFIHWFLVQELVKNQDARDFSSIFYYKDRNGKLGMGPIWDFDLSMGNVNYSVAENPEGWWVRQGPWFSRLFEDPSFERKVQNRWREIRKKEVDAVFENIQKQSKRLGYAQMQNFNVWKILDIWVWPNPAIYYTYEEEVNQIHSWLTKRVEWLDVRL